MCPSCSLQQCYEWGKRSVELIVDRIILKKNPPSAREVSALIPVNRENVDAFEKNWDVWLRK
jgi:hypothetical protein